jgi:hypothetical protein
MNRDFSNLDGEVIDYQVLSGASDLRGNPFEEDNFYSLASGKKRRRKKRKRGGFFNKLLDNQREKNKMKFNVQKVNAEAQKKAAEGMGKESQSDIDLAKAMSQQSSTPGVSEEVKKPMSNNMKIGIAVGVLVLLVGGYFAYTKLKK